MESTHVCSVQPTRTNKNSSDDGGIDSSKMGSLCLVPATCYLLPIDSMGSSSSSSLGDINLRFARPLLPIIIRSNVDHFFNYIVFPL